MTEFCTREFSWYPEYALSSYRIELASNQQCHDQEKKIDKNKFEKTIYLISLHYFHIHSCHL